ncbi:potassium voltage-gated channel subfamily E member 4 [Periophthalmus magnuspinnatus]|uniref:potassium voltage-gated channel subfamily E member 4 n=1 Tax=Periophthalmus magnuspinnatus TaxID=409849 RepID=UPI00145BA9BA|nr:potassium voltage-gated channel subfamily E member 4 [Periophthalmus magnuspinnatus]
MENSTSAHPRLRQLTSTPHPSAPSDGNAFLYILIVLSFYGFFLSAIMFGYFHSKRKEKRRTNIFTKLVHDNEKREWGALPKKHSLTFSSPVPGLTLPFCSKHSGHLQRLGVHGMFPSPLACALCTEQSSVSSLCSSADTRVAIEEEQDCSTTEEPEEGAKGSAGSSADDSG